MKSREPRLGAELANDIPATAEAVWIVAKPSDDLPRGAYELAVVSGGDEAGSIKLHVDDLPHFYLSGTNRTLRLESLPADVWATHEKSGDSEQIEFEAHGRGYLGPFAAEPATSWAAPHLAGVAARILSLRPDLKPFEVKTILYWIFRAMQ